MPYASLREFIARLEGAGRLVRVRAPVSPFLEMTEIQTRLLAEAGPAVLFENVVHPAARCRFWSTCSARWSGSPGAWTGSRTNSRNRRDAGLSEAARAAWRLARGARYAAAAQDRDGDAAAHGLGRAVPEIVLRGGDIDLGLLPVQTCWPDEPAPLITWPLVVTKGPGAAREDNFNLGIYRMQVTGRDTTLMRWLRHRGGAQHHQRWRQRSANRCQPPP